MRLPLSFILIFFTFARIDAQLQLNEIMQSNIDCIMDDLNDFPDSWVEIYNPTSNTINLKNYRIGITPVAKEAYKLPDATVNPNSYYIIYCDKESKNNHTSFRLESGEGGALYLFSDYTIVDRLEDIEKQPAPNVSYGRKSENDASWGYMLTPTPGKNNSEISLGVLPKIIFSEKGRVLEEKQNIMLSLSLKSEAPAETVIRYTSDGTEPTASSSIYTNPILITDNKVIRAKAFCKGYTSQRSSTESYIFHPRKVTLPVISIVSDEKYFYDSNIGILVDGTNPEKKNYQYNWRRPINFEYFAEPNAESEMNQLCEARVQGNASRGFKVKSLAIYANKRFGKKRFSYEFFPDQRPQQTNYKSLALRNAGNDFDYLYMRDAIIQRTMAENADLDWQAWKPAILYINGTYIGMLNIRERSNEDNIFTNYDELEDIDLFENWGSKKAGTWDNFNAFKAFYAEDGHTWDEYAQRMDLVEYINLMTMNLYFNNQDFPGNNIAMWRPRTEDGKWRFIAKDTDFGLGLYGSSPSFNSIAWLYDNTYDPERAWANRDKDTKLFRQLMKDPDFEREFIDRTAIYMGDFMNYDRIWPVWEQMYNSIKDEYPSHRALINKWWPTYSNELSTAKEWLKNRNQYFYQYLSEFYHLGVPSNLSIMTDNGNLTDEDFHIIVNGIPLTQNRLNGQFFQERRLSITSTPSDQTTISGWTTILIDSKGSCTTKNIQGNTISFDMPQCNEFKLIAHLADQSDDIADKTDITGSTPIAFYDVKGIRHDRLQPGINIVHYEDGKVRKVLFSH